MNAPVEKLPFSVVVAPYAVVVPRTNPLTVGLIYPVAVMLPLPVTEVVSTDEAACVVTVGALTARVVVDSIAPYDVPAEFVAYARK